MLHRLSLLWLSLVVPGTIAVALGGPVGLLPHAVFHPLYIATLVVAIVAAVALRRSTRHRGIRVLSLVAAALCAVAIVGQLGEEVVVFLHGGLHAPDELMTEGDHFAWAMAGEGGIFLALFTAVAIGIVAGVALLRAHDRRGWIALLPSAAYVVDLGLSIAGLFWSALNLTTLCAAIALLTVALATRERATRWDAVTRPLRSASASAIVAP